MVMIILFILVRLLFIASMVFIIGYIYGSFSRKRTLTTLARISAILVIVLFIGSNLFFLRSGRWQYRHVYHHGYCDHYRQDSTLQH